MTHSTLDLRFEATDPSGTHEHNDCCVQITVAFCTNDSVFHRSVACPQRSLNSFKNTKHVMGLNLGCWVYGKLAFVGPKPSDPLGGPSAFLKASRLLEASTSRPPGLPREFS